MNQRLAVGLGWHPSLFGNRVIDGEIFLPQLPQDQRSGIDPYLDIPPSTGLAPMISIPKSSDDRSSPSGSFLELSSKDISDLAESLFFTASRRLANGIFRLRADALVSHLKDALKFLLQAFGQLKGIGLVA